MFKYKKKVILFFVGGVLPGFSLAQSVPDWVSAMASKNLANVVSSAGSTNSIATWLGKKVDINNGTSYAESLTNPSLTNTSLFGGVSMTAQGDLPFVPKGSPIAGSVGSFVRHIALSHAGVQNFGDNSECSSTAIAPTNGGNVCSYVYVELYPGSGGGWSQSLVTQIDPSFDTSDYSALISEMDLNNLAGDYGEFSKANSVGLLFNALGFMNTAATSVQTGNSAGGMTGTNGRLATWYYGHHIAAN